MYTNDLFIIMFILLVGFSSLLQAQEMNDQFRQGMIHYELEEYEEAITRFETSLQTEYPFADTYSILASSYLLAGQPGKAIETAEEGLENYPDLIYLKVMKGEAWIQLDYRKAIPLFEEVFQNIKESGRKEVQGIPKEGIRGYLGNLYLQKSGELYQQEDPESAIKDLQRARWFSPEKEAVHHNLVYILLELDKRNAAEAALETALKQFPTSESLTLMKARLLEQEGQTGPFLETLKNLYHLDPSNTDRAVLYGSALLNANRANEANDFFREMIDTHPKERKLYRALIEMNRQRFNLEGALHVLEMKKEQFPGDTKILEEYGESLITAQQYNRARALFDSLSVVHQSAGYARISVHTHLYEKKYDEAEWAYEQAVQTWPDDPVLLREYGQVLEYNRKIEQAKDIYEQVLTLEPDDRIRVKYALLTDDPEKRKGLLASAKNGEYHGAARWFLVKNDLNTSNKDIEREQIRELEAALVGMLGFYAARQERFIAQTEADLQRLRVSVPPLLQPKNDLDAISGYIEDLMLHVRQYLSYEEAIRLINNVVTDMPDSPLLYRHKAELHIENNKPQQAVSNLERAVRMGANDEQAHLNLGYAYAEAGEYDQAVLAYERVLTLDDKYREAYRSLIRISQARNDLDSLCDRWLLRFRNHKENEVLRRYLMDALRRADRFEEAREISQNR